MTRARLGLVATVIAMFLLSASCPAWAAGKGDFEQGIQAFRLGDYERAASLFEAAQGAGMRTPQLLYNLGVTYYKLGRYDDARRNFQTLLDEPSMAPLARYNLAVVADHEGRRDDAIVLLQQVVAQSKDHNLLYLARAKLAELKADTGVWRGFISVTGSYNDNVSVAPSGTAAGPDGFISILAHMESLAHGTWHDGVYLAGNFLTRKFLALNGYDQDVLQAEVRRHANWRAVPVWYGAYGSTSTFGGQAYQDIYGIQAGADWILRGGAHLHARYRYEDIHSLNPVYDYLRGWSQQLRVERDTGPRPRRLVLRYEFEMNGRQDQPGASFSPTSNAVSVRYRMELGRPWSVEAGLSYGISDYPPVGSQNRHDRRADVSLEFARMLQGDLRLRLRYLFTDNESSDATYAYRSNQVDAGISVYF